MNEMAKLREVLKDIRMHCRECMGGQAGGGARCPTVHCRLKKWAAAPVQIDIGDGLIRDSWIQRAANIAMSAIVESGGSAWWSRIRRDIEMKIGAPFHPAWWGGAASALRQAGATQTSRRTCDAIAQRNQAAEWLWSLPSAEVA